MDNTLDTAAMKARYKISTNTFHRWRREGRLPPPATPAGQRPQWTKAQLDAWDKAIMFGNTRTPATPADLISFPGLAERLGLTEIRLWEGIDRGEIPPPIRLDPEVTRRTVCEYFGISNTTLDEMIRRGEVPDLAEGGVCGFDEAVIRRWESLGKPAVEQITRAAKLAEIARPKVEEALRKLRRSTKLSNWLIKYFQAESPAVKLELAAALFAMAGMTAPPDDELRTVAQALN